MKNLTWQNPEQLFVAQVLIKIVKLKCCGIKGELRLAVPTLDDGDETENVTIDVPQFEYA